MPGIGSTHESKSLALAFCSARIKEFVTRKCLPDNVQYIKPFIAKLNSVINKELNSFTEGLPLFETQE
jgi:hypothetical protein